MARIKRVVLAVVLGLALLAPCVTAFQTGQPFRTGVNTVPIYGTATDSRGVLVADLSAQDFEIQDDRRRLLDPMRVESPNAAPRQNSRFVPYNGGPNRRLLNEIANRTDGAVFQRSAGTSLSGLFEQAVEEFRSSYVLTSTPKGVKAEGWHTLTVKLTDALKESLNESRPRLRGQSGYQDA